MRASWLPDPSEESVRAALREIAPELAARPLAMGERPATGDPRFLSSSARAGDVVIKFAWSEEPARRIVHEAAVLRALAPGLAGVPVPEVVVASARPALLATRLVPGEPVVAWDVDALDAWRRRRLVEDLAGVLAALHAPAALAAVRDAGVALEAPAPQAETAALRARLVPLLDPARGRLVDAWCHWTDAVLSAPPPEEALLHADLHGANLLWDRARGRLRLVADWETAALGDPAYDFRAPHAWATRIDILVEVAAAYERGGGRAVDRARAMAWHVRTALGDALWRTEAGVALPGGGTAASWVDDVAARLSALGVGP